MAIELQDASRIQLKNGVYLVSASELKDNFPPNIIHTPYDPHIVLGIDVYAMCEHEKVGFTKRRYPPLPFTDQNVFYCHGNVSGGGRARTWTHSSDMEQIKGKTVPDLVTETRDLGIRIDYICSCNPGNVDPGIENILYPLGAITGTMQIWHKGYIIVQLDLSMLKPTNNFLEKVPWIRDNETYMQHVRELEDQCRKLDNQPDLTGILRETLRKRGRTAPRN